MFSVFSFISKVLENATSDQGNSTIKTENVLAEFSLDNAKLRRLMEVMNRMFDNGLASGLQESSIAMLPSFVPSLPDGSESGRYLAIDLGGTNLRTLLLTTADNDIVIESRNFKMSQSVMTGTGQALFDFITNCLANFLEEKELMDANLPLGFTFSYPCTQLGLRSAILVKWTKGVTASGVEGKDVVQLLEESIKRNGRIKVRVLAILNDTVGTQAAAAYEHKKCDLGVIIATGTNAAYLENFSAITKVQNSGINYPYPKMIINTEWGAFGDLAEIDFVKTQYDHMVDAISVYPGRYSFDKLIAGMYMGELVRLVLMKLVNCNLLFNGVKAEMLYTSGSFPTKYISEILADESGHFIHIRDILDELGVENAQFNDLLILREVCIAVSRRSANLAAAAIAAIISRMNLKKATVAIDGSTYRFHPLYHSWLTHKIPELLDFKTDVHIVHVTDGSGKGAALVAAIAEKMEASKIK